MTESTQVKHNTFGIAVLIIAILASGWVIFTIDLGDSSGNNGSNRPVTESATPLATPRAITGFSLSDHNHQPFTQETLQGRWSLLSFGYTSCPDVCPTGLAALSQMDQQLKQSAADFPYKVFFISVDPARDNLERLAQYVPYFNPDFIGVTGDPKQISGLAQQLGILYAKSEASDSAMGYLVDHSAQFILVDPDGKFHAVFSPPHRPDVMAKDFIAIVNAARR